MSANISRKTRYGHAGTHILQLHTVNLPRHGSHHTKSIHAGHIDKLLTTHAII